MELMMEKQQALKQRARPSQSPRLKDEGLDVKRVDEVLDALGQLEKVASYEEDKLSTSSSTSTESSLVGSI